MGYSPWGHNELDTTERLTHTHTHTHTHTYCVSNLKDSETINGMGGQKDLEESLLLFDNILEVFLRQEVDGPP